MEEKNLGRKVELRLQDGRRVNGTVVRHNGEIVVRVGNRHHDPYEIRAQVKFI